MGYHFAREIALFAEGERFLAAERIPLGQKKCSSRHVELMRGTAMRMGTHMVNVLERRQHLIFI
jgi:hypothetical protein